MIEHSGPSSRTGFCENPSWIAFARENGTVYHIYTVSARDPFVEPYYRFLLSERRKPNPPSRALGGRTSTRTDAE